MKYALLVAALLVPVGCQKGKPAKPTSAPAEAPTPAITSVAPEAAAQIPEDSKWAGSQIAWHSLEAGLERARREDRPVMMVVKTEWCPRCKQYSALFQEQVVQKAAQDFVMVLVDGDRDAGAERYAPDGTYIPRTFFLSPDGEIDTSLHGAHPRYRYFINSTRAEGLAELMARASDQLDG